MSKKTVKIHHFSSYGKRQEKYDLLNNTEFANVPKNIWEFYIEGYQPAQKWLKDRKDRSLNYEDIIHYSKMILSLSETIRIMEEIENIYNK